MIWKIARIGKDEVVSYAASELKKYLSQMDPSYEYVLMMYPEYDPALQNVLWVGQDDSFPLPDVPDPKYDDAVSIQVTGQSGYITGTNPRSILIAVYRFLRELGCVFLRPGMDGEIIPACRLNRVNVSVFEAASYRHRSICIEGAVSAEHVINMIDWMPKVGMNGYFNQFRYPNIFYKYWYTHEKNPLYQPEEYTVKDSEGITNQSIYEIKKRGLLYHAVGHSWACGPFGIDDMGGLVDDKDVPEEVKPHLALINGKRSIPRNIPMLANMCYSSEYVNKTMSEAVVKYCEQVPEVDYLHVWLADGDNNHCECEKCGNRRPSDFYVDLLNRIDRLLTEKNIDTKIVFLLYTDLLWEPEESKLNNPDRFVLMFAPITRTYSDIMANAGDYPEEELAPYVKNKIELPKNVDENVARLRKWQKCFTGDSFVFDYHYMWDHYYDPGYYQMADILFHDMKHLDKLGLNGMVSCQAQRVFFPTGLGMLAMAEALWNKNCDFYDIVKKYFQDAYGNNGIAVMEYMSTLSNLFDPPYWRIERTIIDETSAKSFDRIPQVVDCFTSIISRNIGDSGKDTLAPAQLLNWTNLTYHGVYCKLLAKALGYMARGNYELAVQTKNTVISYMQLHESKLHDIFDVYVFIDAITQVFLRMEKAMK